MLYLLQTTQWKLLDLGIAGTAGTLLPPRCTLAYAPPEVVSAAVAACRVTVHPSHDVWALGVVAFEAVVQRKAMPGSTAMRACALGEQLYPWEAPHAEQPAAWRQSRLRALVAPCLDRDPMQRPTAAQIVDSAADIGHAASLTLPGSAGKDR